MKTISCSLINISLSTSDVDDGVNKCIVKAIGRRKYFDRVFGDSCIYFQPHFMNERCISDVITTRKLFIEELPAAYGGHQNHWRHLDGKVIERLDYLSDVFELSLLNCKPNMKRIIDLLTTTVQPELLGPILRYKLLQMKQKPMQCSKRQNRKTQTRRNSKQKNDSNVRIKALSSVNFIPNTLRNKPDLLANQYLDEMPDKLEEAEQLYNWSQCLPQL
ncbi:hypothetical protein EWB00_003958 [Schistosoma japonicum]|nr:hypothetical protein EWB00_003958 [Schistosoma japonicum]